MKDYLRNACESVDAAMFTTGDALEDPTTRQEIAKYVGRLVRALNTPTLANDIKERRRREAFDSLPDDYEVG